MKLTIKEETYLKELAADIIANGGLNGKTMMEVVKEAHKRRQAFALEMASQETHRASMVKEVLSTQIWLDINREAANEEVIRKCEIIYDRPFGSFG